MDTFSEWVSVMNGWVWGPLMISLIIGVGVYLHVGLKFMPLRNIGGAFRLLFSCRHDGDENNISPFAALMTALSSTIGTGNIAGVATAIFIGGPGALFWMWCAALVGMATKYAEAFCAVKYRETDHNGRNIGGPMYYIRNGLGQKWAWLAALFALFAGLASFGIGNMVQANSIAIALQSTLDIPRELSAAVLVVLVAGVVLGGIQRIGAVAEKLVPLMAVSYVSLGLVTLIINLDQLPEAASLIFHSAFNPVSATGGFAGAGVVLAIKMGVARGIFSNEAGLGSAAMAHAASAETDPVRQGTIAMLGTFIDTIIVCSITGLVIVSSGLWSAGDTGSALTTAAFEQALPGYGGYLVAIALSVFAFTTILGWGFYSEKAFQYLLGDGCVWAVRILWVAVIPVGALMKLDLIWLLADTLNGMMAIPNLIALLLLGLVVFKMTSASALVSTPSESISTES